MEKSLKYVFGPVPSRRLGRSLGVNPIPFKTCNYSCVYCQLGKAINYTNERKLFFPPAEIAKEIIEVCEKKEDKIDYITFVGEGEPTLYSGIPEVVKMVRKACNIQLAIITNGALFYEKSVREDVAVFDVVLTKLDAPFESLFKKINRPYPGIRFEKVLSGLFELREEHKGRLWTETMLVKGLNDNTMVLKEIRKILDELKPDRRFVSIPTRPPAEKWVKVPSPDVLFTAFKILNAIPVYHIEYGEINVEGFATLEEAILNIIKRHPLRIDEINSILRETGYKGDTMEFIEKLRLRYNVKLRKHLGYTYLLPKEARI